jgi:hypothetical protein
MWAVVARVVNHASSVEQDDPIQQFMLGSRVTLLSFPDMNSDAAEVTGRHHDRFEKAAESAYTTAIVSTVWLCDWTVERIHSRAILARLRGKH